MSGSLVLYEQMAAAVAKCIAIDEADQIRSKAAKIEAYARIRDDRETQTKFSELRLRATQRIGELSREMETAERARTDLPLNGERQTKQTQLKQAGIAESTARRYEQLSGPREEQAERIVKSATSSYFANLDGKSPSFKGLRNAVQTALVETYGEPPPRSKPHELSPEDRANMTWSCLLGYALEVDPELAATGEHEKFAQTRYNEATEAIKNIRRYQQKLTELYGCK